MRVVWSAAVAAVVLMVSCSGGPSGAGGGSAGGGSAGGGSAGGGTAGGGSAGGAGGGTSSSGGGGAPVCTWVDPQVGRSGECAGKPGAPSDAGAAPSTTQLTPTLTRFENLTYATRGGYVLQGDLVVPPLDAGAPGILLVVHGGGWQDCDRRRLAGDVQSYAAVMAALHGIATFNLEYRLRQEGGGWPASLEDVRCAAQWVASHAKDWGLDGTRLAIAGESAGAHLAVMAALTNTRADLDPGCGDAGVNWKVVLEYSGPADLPELTASGLPVSTAPPPYAGPCDVPVNGCTNGRACNRCVDASPTAHACESAPDTIFAVIHAAEGHDALIPLSQATKLHRTLADAGLDARLMVPTPGESIDAGCAMGVAHGWNALCLVRTSAAEVLPLLRGALGPR